MEVDKLLNEIILAAYNEAKAEKHEFITPEHILYAALFFENSKNTIIGCGGDIIKLKKELEIYFDEYIEKADNKDPVQTIGVDSILSGAASHVLSCGKKEISFSDVLVAIFDEEDCFGSFFLKEQGVTRLDILNFIAHGVSKPLEKEAIKKDTSKKGTDKNEDTENSLLNNFAVELTEKARKGELDPLIGREDVLERTIQVLCRRHKNNPIHVGEPGVGKTAITEGIAQLIAAEKVPKLLRNCKIYSLDMGGMLAGTKYRGDFEERIKGVLNEILKEENALVFIDEIHTVIGAGSITGGAMDASNILKPFLDRGRLRVIGSTTYDEYKKIFDKDRALSRRFQKIEITESNFEDTLKILEGLKDRYENYHNVTYSEKALRATVELAIKYLQDRHLPDKAIDILDEAGAYARIHNSNEDMKVCITERDIERIVASMGKVPEESVSANEIDKLRYLEQELKKVIFGQDTAIVSVTNAIKRSRAGFKDEEKPIANILFVGPTGVGKTELTKQLSEKLGIPLIRFDMSEYQEKHTVARLIGSPPGYVGYEEGGLLTETIRKTPHCVLLLDEIEKVHADILNVLLQVMDYGKLTDNTGKKTDFKNVILIMTSNAGAKELGKTLIGFGERILKEEAINKEVERIFSPEFRNRLDETVVFNKMDESMALLIARKAIKSFAEKLKVKNIELNISNNCYEWIASRGLSSNFGAREINRIVEQEIKPFFVDEVLFGELSNGGTAYVDIINGKLDIKNNK